MQACHRLLSKLCFMLMVVLATITPSFADPFACEELSTTFPGFGPFEPVAGAIFLPSGPFGVRQITGVGVIGTAYYTGQPSPIPIVHSLGNNEFEVNIQDGGTQQAKFLVQCRTVPDQLFSTAIWGAPVSVGNRGSLFPNQNIASIQLISSDAGDTYRITTTAAQASVNHHISYLIGGEVVPPSGGFFGSPGGLGNFQSESVTNVVPLVAGPVQKPSASDSEKQGGKKGAPGSGEEASQNDPKEKGGDPVDLFSGAYVINNVDLSMPGILPPQVSRSYSSAFGNQDGPFGKGTGMVPYNASITIHKENDGTVTVAPGTELQFNVGEHTDVAFVDAAGILEFTSPGSTGFAGERITVQKNAQNHMLGAQLHKPNGDKWFFNAAGKLIKMQDRNGNALEITRDSDQKVIRIADPSTGKGIDFVYNGNGHITQATGLAGQTVSYAYDDQGRLISLSDPAGQSVHFEYDADGQITKTTDARGTDVVTNTYNTDGRVTHQVLGDGSTVDFEYPDDSRRIVTDGIGHKLERRYRPESGHFTGYKTELNQEYTTTYSPALFDNSGGPRTVTNTDPLGRMSVTELNERNQPVRITDAASRVTEFTYEPNFHLLATIKDPLGRITSFTYDSTGNLIKVTDPDGNAAAFTYNGQGQVLTAKDPLGQVANYTYDANHDLKQVADPLGNKTQFAYDNLSRLTKVTDAKGNATEYTYDILNRVTRIKDALSNETTFAYDENGNVTSVTDPRGHITTASYDPMNRLTSVTNAKGETSTLNYDGAGNVVSTTDPKGQTTSYSYNPLNQVTRVQHDDGTTYSYEYDNANRLKKITDGTGQWNFAYDVLDRIIQAGSPQGTLNYTYDLVSRLTGFTSPGTGYAPVQYAYDNLDRLVSITQNGKAYGYQYDKLGRRTSLTRPNGVMTTYTYDAASRLTALSHKKGAQVLEGYSYSYDANGNIVRQVKSGGPFGEITRDYEYDKLNRLVKVDAVGILASSQFKNSGNANAAMQHLNNAIKLTNPTARQQQLRNAVKLGAALPENASWTFDENGNIVEKKSLDWETGQWLSRSMSYDEADRLVGIAKTGPLKAGEAASITLQYDANGNLVSDTMGRSFTWNTLDQLTRLQTSQFTATFAYDPLGRRTGFAKGATSKNYFLNGLDALSDGSSKFLHGAGVDEALQIDTANGSMSYLQDHLGSTSQLMDALNANSKARLDYKSYGKLEGDVSNPEPKNPYTYTGREDDGTGLMYYRARYYDPEMEVFISQDPLGASQRYVIGNPLLYSDPLGWEQYKNLIILIGDPLTAEPADLATSKVAAGVPSNTPQLQAKSPQELKSILSNNTISDTLVIRGHGSESDIGATGGFIGSGLGAKPVIGTSDLPGAFGPISMNKGLPAQNTPPKRIVILSCNTGAGNNPIAQILSNNIGSGTEVVAPKGLVLGASQVPLGGVAVFRGGQIQSTRAGF